MIGAPIGDLASLLDPGPAATALAAGALALMVFGAVGTMASGRWYWRSILVVGALVWPLPDHADSHFRPCGTDSAGRNVANR